MEDMKFMWLFNREDSKRNLYLDSSYLTGLSHIVYRLFMSLSWMWMVWMWTVVVQEWWLCGA